MKALVIDISKCNGCHNCQIACKDEHVGNDWTPYAKPQPIIGQFWTKVTDITRGTVPKVKVGLYALDMPALRRGAVHHRLPAKSDLQEERMGSLLIDPEKCAGNRNCNDACPYEGVIYFNRDLNISQKCTFCAHLLDKGWKEPRCVDVCPTGALTFGEEDDLGDLLSKAESIASRIRNEAESLLHRPAQTIHRRGSL